jgi:hypothetical protein
MVGEGPPSFVERDARRRESQHRAVVGTSFNLVNWFADCRWQSDSSGAYELAAILVADRSARREGRLKKILAWLLDSALVTFVTWTMFLTIAAFIFVWLSVKLHLGTFSGCIALLGGYFLGDYCHERLWRWAEEYALSDLIKELKQHDAALEKDFDN